MTRITARLRRALRIENLESRQLMATVSGVVFNDINGNGTQEFGDVALPNRTVFMDLDGDSTVDAGEPTILTDANGAYSFPIPAVTTWQLSYVALALPAPEATGRWQNTNSNYQNFLVEAPAGVDTTLNFGTQFVPYSTFQPLGSEMLVGDNAKLPALNQTRYYGWRNIATDDAGNYATIFTRELTGGKEQVNLTGFNANGTLRTSEIAVTSNSIGRHMVAMSRDGSRIAVAWMQKDSIGSYAPFVQVFDASGGRIGSTIQVAAFGKRSATLTYLTGIEMDNTGNFAVLSVRDSTIQFQRYTRAGVASGSAVTVSTGVGVVNNQAVIGMDSAGKFVVTWHTTNGIYAQRYSATGSTVGSRILVAASTGGPGVSSLMSPTIAMNASGRFVLAWYKDIRTTPTRVAQVYDANANPLGGLVNNIDIPGTIDYDYPGIATINAAGFVTFPYVRSAMSFNPVNSSVEDSRASDIWVRQMSPSGVLSESQIVNSTTQGFQTLPSIAATPSGFIVTWLGTKLSGGSGVFTQQYQQAPATALASQVAASSTIGNASAVDYLMALTTEDPFNPKARGKASIASTVR